jgi:hypothetical protein
MNILRPVLTLGLFAVRVVMSDAFLQVVGLGLLVAAAAVQWGTVGGLVAGGVALVTVGVAMERGT